MADGIQTFLGIFTRNWTAQALRQGAPVKECSGWKKAHFKWAFYSSHLFQIQVLGIAMHNILWNIFWSQWCRCRGWYGRALLLSRPSTETKWLICTHCSLALFRGWATKWNHDENLNFHLSPQNTDMSPWQMSSLSTLITIFCAAGVLHDPL